MLSLPSRPDTFGSYIDALSISTRMGDDKENAWDDERVLVAAVGAIEVSLDVDVEISSTESTELTREKHSKEIERGQAALDGAFPTVLDVAANFISWLRVCTGRYWLAPSHEAPGVLSGDLVEKSSGRRVRNIGFSPVVHITSFGGDTGLTAEELDQVAALLTAGEVPDTPEVLLADALETLAGPSVEHDWQTLRRDLRRSILLAAIASEVKIKTTLAAKAPVDKAALVEIILKNLREVEVAVGELPHKTMKAAVGRSLHEDHPALFGAVKKLFKDRNDVAHRGEPPSLEEARTDVKAAVDLFSWLDSLPDPA